jgi:hypothetical protein
MGAPNSIQFVKQYTAVGQGNVVGNVSLDEISKMTSEEFAAIDGRLLSVRRRKRHDVACFEAVSIAAGTNKDIFRKGIGQQDTYATSNTAFTKTRWHTDMARDGDFGEGSLTIIKSIEVGIATFALKGTTYTAGAVTNPLGVAISNYDPALLEATLVKWAEINFFRGETYIVGGQAEDFGQANIVTGVAGAAVGAIFQNGSGLEDGLLDNPQVFRDNEDFHVNVNALHALDMSTGSGLFFPVNVFVKFDTTELRQNYA